MAFQLIYSLLIIAYSHQHMFSVKPNVRDEVLFVQCVPVFENSDSYVREAGNSPRNVLKQIFLKNSGKYYVARRDALVRSANAKIGKHKVMHLCQKGKERRKQIKACSKIQPSFESFSVWQMIFFSSLQSLRQRKFLLLCFTKC